MFNDRYYHRGGGGGREKISNEFLHLFIETEEGEN